MEKGAPDGENRQTADGGNAAFANHVPARRAPDRNEVTAPNFRSLKLSQPMSHPLERNAESGAYDAALNGGAREGVALPARRTPVVLCIAGFDPCGGAGLLADARACAAFGAFALGAQTALVPQNTVGVRAITPTSPEVLTTQLEALGEDIAFDAVKIGLLPSVESIAIVTAFLRGWKAQKWLPVVLDPTLSPSSGAAWSDDATIAALLEQLWPLATLVTPNAPEAQVLSGCAVANRDDMEAAARALAARGAANVLVKGGHLEALETQRRGERADALAVDLFFDGREAHQLRARRVEGVEVRGTGCLLASAIAAQLAEGGAPLDAARKAKSWLSTQLRDARALGQGRRIAVF